jgi:phage N-6-adenine-methyltransferase
MKAYQVEHNDTFNTPLYIYEQLDSVFSFQVDAACDSTNHKAPCGFMIDKGVSGLDESWANQRVFCNPPFSEKKQWIEKAILEVERNSCPICVMILPLNCMSTSFFYELVIKGGYRYQVPKGRIQFLNNKTKETQKGNNSGTVIVYFMKDVII